MRRDEKASLTLSGYGEVHLYPLPG